MSTAVILIVVVLAVVVVIALAFVVSYNRFKSQQNLIDESWKQIDVELQRRFDLVPNLIETVKGYAAHERSVIESVTTARTEAQGHAGETPAARVESEAKLGRAVGGLIAVAENYPDLKASANFLELQQELSRTEDRIAAGRRIYNGNVRAYNTRLETVPSNLVAGMFSFRPADFFEMDDDPQARGPVRVEF